MQPTVYFLFDAYENIIYVGSSINLQLRIKQHQNEKEWFKDVAYIAYKTYKNRGFMIKWEKLFILDLSPKYNKKDKILTGVKTENLFEDQVREITESKISIHEFQEKDLKANRNAYLVKEAEFLRKELRKRKKIDKIAEDYKKAGYKIVELPSNKNYSINLFDSSLEISNTVFKYNDHFIKIITAFSINKKSLEEMNNKIDLLKNFIFKKERLQMPEEVRLALEIVRPRKFGSYNLFQKLVLDKYRYLVDVKWADYRWLTIDPNISAVNVNLDLIVKGED